MNRIATTRALGFLCTAGLLLHPTSVHACAMCMGAPDSHNGAALNGAIFLMLGCLGAMMAGIGAVAFSFARRAKSSVASTGEPPTLN
jgi:hypothetical protein